MNKTWWKAAGIRSLKTFCQTAISLLTVGQAMIDINWINVISVSVVSAIVSILTSITGLPEVEDGQKEITKTEDSEEVTDYRAG